MASNSSPSRDPEYRRAVAERREKVAQLTADGWSRQRIARALEIGESTVSNDQKLNRASTGRVSGEKAQKDLTKVLDAIVALAPLVHVPTKGSTVVTRLDLDGLDLNGYDTDEVRKAMRHLRVFFTDLEKRLA